MSGRAELDHHRVDAGRIYGRPPDPAVLRPLDAWARVTPAAKRPVPRVDECSEPACSGVYANRALELARPFGHARSRALGDFMSGRLDNDFQARPDSWRDVIERPPHFRC